MPTESRFSHFLASRTHTHARSDGTGFYFWFISWNPREIKGTGKGKWEKTG